MPVSFYYNNLSLVEKLEIIKSLASFGANAIVLENNALEK